ncbi:MAG: hypothetical protein D6705_01610 [Deltaproteobacteria bacterium]|nr:MAG: hypothetical protein D6705_01610 [Deltaproteobacteria bacterium]
MSRDAPPRDDVALDGTGGGGRRKSAHRPVSNPAMFERPWVAYCAAAVLVAACGSNGSNDTQAGTDGGEGGGTGTSGATTIATSGATASATSQGSASASGTSASTGSSGGQTSSTDSGTGTTAGSGGTAGTGGGSQGTGGGSATGGGTATGGTTGGIVCTKVDVVFAVDNSGSMQQEIAAMQGPVFDALPDQLLMVGNGIDEFHLGVKNACPKPGYLHDTGDGGPCNFSTGKNWMSSDSPNLDAEYACVMELTDAGYMGMNDQCVDAGDLKDDDEQPAQTAARVVSPPAVDQQNAGFLQDDALLFVVAMTDEDEELIDDMGNPLTPQEVADRIIAAKGVVDNVVFLGIGGASNCNGPYGSANDAVNLQAITQIFVDADRGLFWDLCQGDLETAFAQAIEIVDQACFDIVPQ